MRIKFNATSYLFAATTSIFLLLPNSSSAEESQETNEVAKKKTSAERAGFKSDLVFQLARIADTLVSKEEEDEIDMLGFSPKHLASLFASKKQTASRRQGRTFTVDPDRIYEVRVIHSFLPVAINHLKLSFFL